MSTEVPKVMDITYYVAKRSTIYISGKMTGLDDLGKASMDHTEGILRRRGYVNIINPFYEVDQTKQITWVDAMKIDIAQIMSRKVEAMVLIDGWKSSKGACLEVILFVCLGIPIYMWHDGSIMPKDVLSELTPEYLHEMVLLMNRLSNGG